MVFGVHAVPRGGVFWASKCSQNWAIGYNKGETTVSGSNATIIRTDARHHFIFIACRREGEYTMRITAKLRRTDAKMCVFPRNQAPPRRVLQLLMDPRLDRATWHCMWAQTIGWAGGAAVILTVCLVIWVRGRKHSEQHPFI